MTTLNTNDELEVNSIKPIIPTEFYKLMRDEMSNLVNNLLDELQISDNDIKKKYESRLNNIGEKLGIKKRNRRSLPTELQCMGRKIDGKQCTRSKLSGLDFCKSHHENLPQGRIDDNDYKMKEKGKRGRKKKDELYNNDQYLAVYPEVFNDGNQYFVDSNNLVYSYNIENPEFLGIKNSAGMIVMCK